MTVQLALGQCVIFKIHVDCCTLGLQETNLNGLQALSNCEVELRDRQNSRVLSASPKAVCLTDILGPGGGNVAPVEPTELSPSSPAVR